LQRDALWLSLPVCTTQAEALPGSWEGWEWSASGSQPMALQDDEG
jgi:hypothetical protein